MMGFGNIFYYFLFISIMAIITIACMRYLKNKDSEFIHKFIFYLLLSAFVLHFMKLLFEPYASNLPYSFKKITFENICAVSTLVFPWFYLSKRKMLKEYMLVIGIFSGLGTVLFPYQSVGFTAITIDIVRFYYAHFILFLAPLLMLYTGQYELSLNGVFKVPLLFYFILVVIFCNEVILLSLGMVDGDFSSLLDPNTRNMALIFGPNDQLAQYSWLYGPFVPEVFTTVPMGADAGTPLYWPIIWLIIPAYFYIVLGGLLLKLIFHYKTKYYEASLPNLSDEMPILPIADGNVFSS